LYLGYLKVAGEGDRKWVLDNPAPKSMHV
jgi:hypothetical protein